MIFSIIGEMGMGKTLFASLCAFWYSQTYPNRKIYANYHLKLPNAHFSPFLFLPLSEISESMIIADDIYAMPNIRSLLSLIVNISRKNSLDVLLTAQYYTMVHPIIRSLSMGVELFFAQDHSLLTARVTPPNDFESERKAQYFEFVEPLAVVGHLYDTREIVSFTTESRICKEIARFSHNIDDLEANIALYTNNQSVRKRLLKTLTQECGFSQTNQSGRAAEQTEPELADFAFDL